MVRHEYARSVVRRLCHPRGHLPGCPAGVSEGQYLYDVGALHAHVAQALQTGPRGADPLDVGLTIPRVDQRLTACDELPIGRHHTQITRRVIDRPAVAVSD